MDAPIDLNLVRAFVAVHETASFSRAAERLGLPRSTVSRAISALEDALGLSLFRRTTRTVATTDEGRRLFERVAPDLASLEVSLADLPDREDAMAGTLRLTAIPDLASAILTDAVSRFAARWPRVDVDLRLTGELVDLARDNIDLALRVQLRAPRVTSLVTRRVGAIAVQLYAAPGYLARRGVPRDLDDFEGHDWITFRGAAPLRPTSPWGTELRPRRRIACDDMRFAADLVRGGVGVGALPSFLVGEDLVSGTLVRVLPRVVLGTAAVYLVRPARTHVPARVTAFRDLVLDLLRQRPLAPLDPAG
jgi:DNA-binding transcriptional LysR family regulator